MSPLDQPTQYVQNLLHIVDWMREETGVVVSINHPLLVPYLMNSSQRNYIVANLIWQEITGVPVSGVMLRLQLADRLYYNRVNP